MATTQCITPINQAIHQALLDKAASYPADKQYQANAYKKVAESVSGWNYSLYNEYLPSIPGIGPSIQKFIEEFIKNASNVELPKPTTPNMTASATATAVSAVMTAILDAPIGQPLTAQQIASIVKEEFNKVPAPVKKLTCKVPDNQPIYYALIRKAEIYPDQNGYQANAYRKAAESVLTFEYNIVAGVSKYDDYWSMDEYVPNVGTKIANYITSIVMGIKDTTAATTAATISPAELRNVVARANIKTLRHNAEETALNSREAALNAREAALNLREIQIKVKEAEAAAAAAISAANAAEKALTNA
jgi:DNA polymerase/3'-5' exonuclease PolX